MSDLTDQQYARGMRMFEHAGFLTEATFVVRYIRGMPLEALIEQLPGVEIVEWHDENALRTTREMQELR